MSRLCASIRPWLRNWSTGTFSSLGDALPVCGDVFRRCCFQLLPDLREAIEHELEIFAGDAHHFDVVERGTGRDPRSAGEQGHLAKVRTARQVGQDQISHRDAAATPSQSPRRTR